MHSFQRFETLYAGMFKSVVSKWVGVAVQLLCFCTGAGPAAHAMAGMSCCCRCAPGRAAGAWRHAWPGLRQRARGGAQAAGAPAGHGQAGLCVHAQRHHPALAAAGAAAVCGRGAVAAAAGRAPSSARGGRGQRHVAPAGVDRAAVVGEQVWRQLVWAASACTLLDMHTAQCGHSFSSSQHGSVAAQATILSLRARGFL